MRKAEKQLLNERITAINNAIQITSWERGTFINQLVSIFDQDACEECQAFISMVWEARHRCVREKQVGKYNRCWLKTSGGCSKVHSSSGKGKGYMYNNYIGHSNASPTNITASIARATATPGFTTTTSTPAPDTTNGKWIKNLSSRSLTEAQVTLLAMGPMYTVVSWYSPKGVYVAAIEKSVSTPPNGRGAQGRNEQSF